jgi:hypothetical protein
MQIRLASQNSLFFYHGRPRFIHNVVSGLQVFGKIAIARVGFQQKFDVLAKLTPSPVIIIFACSSFQVADLGFTPQNYYTDSVGFSLWSYAAPNGRCLSYAEVRQSGIFSSDGGGRNVYSTSFISNDISWTISRILAVVGPVLGSFALVCVEN